MGKRSCFSPGSISNFFFLLSVWGGTWSCRAIFGFYMAYCFLCCGRAQEWGHKGIEFPSLPLGLWIWTLCLFTFSLTGFSSNPHRILDMDFHHRRSFQRIVSWSWPNSEDINTWMGILGGSQGSMESLRWISYSHEKFPSEKKKIPKYRSEPEFINNIFMSPTFKPIFRLLVSSSLGWQFSIVLKIVGCHKQWKWGDNCWMPQTAKYQRNRIIL